MTRVISVCDAETDPFKIDRVPAPFIWGWFDGEEYKCFRDTSELVEWLKCFDGICYAHNGGRFDWHFLLPFIEPYGEIMLINGRISKMRLGLCELRDSINIIPVPLKSYKKDEIDYSIMEAGERDKPANMRKIKEYLRSDCVYLFDLVSRFVKDYGMQLTQAGAAMKQWVKISGSASPQTNEEFYSELSAYYYGGRVECFRSGVIEGNYNVYDINSAYPFAMLEKHPYSENYSITKGYNKNADFYKVRCVSHGAFPFRGLGLQNGRSNAGLTFPRDNEMREYTVSKWEYNVAIETCTISDVEVVESVSFMGHTDFSEYVNHFYEFRQKCKRNGDAAGSLFGKLFLNSLYGKFAANPANYKNYMNVPLDVIGSLDSVGWKFAGEFGGWGLAESPLDEDRMRYYNVATGASITGYVRAMLWLAICESDDVLYCDTDSITVKSAPNLKLGEALGEWKHEGVYDKIGIAGKKMYIMRGAPDWWQDVEGNTLQSDARPKNASRLYKTASKGVRLTNAQLWRVAKGGSVFYESEVPTFSPKKKTAFVKRKIEFTA